MPLIRGVQLLIGKRGTDRAQAGRELSYHAAAYIVRGHGRFRDAVTAEQEVGPGSLLLLRAGVWHRFWPHDAWDEYIVVFEAGDARAAFGDIVPDGPGHLARPPDPELAGWFERLDERWPPQRAADDVRCRHLLHEILFRFHDAWLGPGRSGGDDVVARTRALLRTHLTAPRVDLRRFAREQGVSAERLRKRFAAATGLPPHRYWLLLKLRRAEHLLRDTGMPVQDVAGAVGIADAFYFSRLFARHAGMSPRAFRARAR